MPYGWAAAAAAVGGALISSNSADQASGAQQKTSKDAMNLSLRQNDLSRADAAPYREAGKSSLMTLRQMLGIQPGAQGPITQNYAGSLVDSSGGAPAPIAELYGSDPAYRKAWDEYDQLHRERFGKGYTAESDAGFIERAVRARLPEQSSVAAQAPQDPFAGVNDSPLTRKFTVDDFWNDPVTKLGYQFGLDEGRKGLDRSGASRGMLNSGAQLKALTRFGTDYAGTKAADSENRFRTNQDSVYNKFANVAGLGQVSTAQTGQTGAMNAANVGNIMTAAGNARGAAAIAQGNAYSGGLNNIGQWWNQQNMVNQLNSGQNRTTPRGYYDSSYNQDPSGGGY